MKSKKNLQNIVDFQKTISNIENEREIAKTGTMQGIASYLGNRIFN